MVLLYCLDFADPEDLAIFVYSLLCSVKKIRLDFFGSSNKKRTKSIILYIIFLSHGQTPVQCWTAVGDGSPCSALQPCLVTKQWQQLSSCFRFWFEWTSSSQRISKEQGLLFPAAVQDGGHKMGLETAELHWMWKSEWCSCARQVADSWGTEFQNKNNGIVHQSFSRHNR